MFQQGFVSAVRQLQYDSDRKPDARIPAVVKVVPVVIIDVNVIGVVPAFRPVFWPGIHEQERKTAVREPRIPHVDRGAAVHPEPVLTPEIETEAVLRNVVTAIASTLHPGPMLAFPPLSTTLLPCTMPLPATLLQPSPLLLPRDCLLLRTVRLLLLPGLLGTLSLLLLRPLLLSLLDPLLLWLLLQLRLLLPLLPGLLGALSLLLLLSLLDPLLLWWLSGLSVPRLRLVLLLLSACLRSLRLSLRVLLLCGRRRALLLPTLLLFRLALFLVLLVVLRVRRDTRPEKQKQGCGTGSSNELHSHRPPLRSISGMHADDQSALTMFQRLCCLRLGPGLVHRPIRVVGRGIERVQL